MMMDLKNKIEKVMFPETSGKIDRYMMDEMHIPGIILMERAASGIAQEIMKEFPAGGKAAVFCGGGNNGGDGYAAARILLTHGFSVVCISLTERELPQDAEINRNFIRNYKDTYISLTEDNLEEVFEKVQDCHLVIDAIFGTGLSREPAGIYLKAIERINGLGKKVFAVDIPSGVFGKTGQYSNAVRAYKTITFQYRKPAHILYPGAEMCGEVVVCPIGLDGDQEADMYYVDTLVMPKRKRNTHKGSYGSLALVVGSKGMAGAAVLSASASVAGGSGLTKVICPETALRIVQEQVTEATCVVSGTYHLAEEDFPYALCETATALAAGPGLGQNEEIRNILLKLLDQNHPKVFDADALNNLTAEDLRGKENLVITPHPKEFSRLFGISMREVLADPVSAAKTAAKEYGIVILLKGAASVITDGNEVYLVGAGSPAMAKGGSGDVLTGLIGSLLAQGLKSIEAAYSAAYFCGEAGSLAAKRKGEYSAKARDTIELLGHVMENKILGFISTT
ncbi:MAG: NAD(P)H-hydrate dehydratase [Clostridiales bacterium]|nr:NAD(P)H-hydrate dehydratase [Clostridiales bacterium]